MSETMRTCSLLQRSHSTDFWTVPGYLGANPPASLLKGLIEQSSTIKLGIREDQAIKMRLTNGPLPGEAHGTADAAWKNLGEKEGTMPVAFQLEEVLPNIQFLGGLLIIKSGDAAGKTLFLKAISGDKVILASNDLKVYAQIKPGDEVEVDNSSFLAAQTYHRHQLPGKNAV